MTSKARRPSGTSERWGGSTTSEQRIRHLESVLEEHQKVAGLTVNPSRAPTARTRPTASFDSARAAIPSSFDHAGALQRLQRYGRELAVEVSVGSPEGQRALRSVGSHARGEHVENLSEETRSLTTAAGSGGAFVTPVYAVEQAGLYRSFGPAVFSQCDRVPDPGSE